MVVPSDTGFYFGTYCSWVLFRSLEIQGNIWFPVAHSKFCVHGGPGKKLGIHWSRVIFEYIVVQCNIWVPSGPR